MKRIWSVLLVALLLAGAQSPDAPRVTITQTAVQKTGELWELTLRVEGDAQGADITVTDTRGAAFRYAVQTAQAITLAPDGVSFTWRPTALPAEITYLVRLNDPDFAHAGTDLFFSESTILTLTHKEERQHIAAQRAYMRYQTGTLRVESTGLPTGAQAAQTQITAVCSDTARFCVPPPADAPEGYQLVRVRVNDESLAPSTFAQQTAYSLPVVAGETAVYYDYAPLRTTPATWRYSVHYYFDGIENTALTYIGSVPAARPVVTQLPTRGALLDGYYENPVCALPYTLSQDGERISLYYLSIPSPDTGLTVRHTYLADMNSTEGAALTSPSHSAGHCAVSELAQAQYGAEVYTLIAASITRVTNSVDGEPQSETTLLSPDSTFFYDAACTYDIQLIYSRTTLSPTAVTDTALPTASPLSASAAPRTAPHKRLVSTLPMVALGTLGAVCAVWLQHCRARK